MLKMKKKLTAPRILFMSSMPPTQCGIATYNNDLMNGILGTYFNYFEIRTCQLTENINENVNSDYCINPKLEEDFSRVAHLINQDKNIKLIHIQHEFGLFGGNYGSNLFAFLEVVKKPIVFTFHTVLPNPNDELKYIVQKLASYAKAIFVMTQKSIEILTSFYHINSNKIVRIQHGTHLVKWQDQETIKERAGFKDKLLLSTFGLLGPGKGIETGLMALPEIISKFPQVLYLVIGCTHPNNIKEGRDSYREMLESLVTDLGIKDNVLFINEYLELPKLLELLQATDIYLFTSKDPNQAVSGTFAYAMSCACPIIATSIPHTREVLTPDLGRTIEIGDYKSLAVHTIELLSNIPLRISMGINALQKTRETAWENIALKHFHNYQKIIGTPKVQKVSYPEIKLDHLKQLTTVTGIIQFSKISIPDRSSGYTLDDNARALIAFCYHYEQFKNKEVISYISLYLDFVILCQKANGTFINYIDENNQVHIKNDYVNLEDSNARAIWALGTVISFGEILPNSIIERANSCFLKCKNWVGTLLSPRAVGFAIKGLYRFYTSRKDEWASIAIDQLAKNLISNYDLNTAKTWKWYEQYLTYANSILPEAMLCAYLATHKKVYKDTAMESFDFLMSKMFTRGEFKVISNRGWYHINKKAKRYGEQPIDVAYTIEALELFYYTFKNPEYKNKMNKAFNWFMGDNHLQQIIYDPQTGGCLDGLEKTNVNLNQGAESSICYLIARLIIERNNKPIVARENYRKTIKRKTQFQKKEKTLLITQGNILRNHIST